MRRVISELWIASKSDGSEQIRGRKKKLTPIPLSVAWVSNSSVSEEEIAGIVCVHASQLVLIGISVTLAVYSNRQSIVH